MVGYWRARSVKIIFVESLYILTPPIAPRNLHESAVQCFVEFKENFKIMCGSNIYYINSPWSPEIIRLEEKFQSQGADKKFSGFFKAFGRHLQATNAPRECCWIFRAKQLLIVYWEVALDKTNQSTNQQTYSFSPMWRHSHPNTNIHSTWNSVFIK